jgi:uncharacterized membrane protein
MYLTLKTLHILAVVLFLGNIITGVFWKAHADRTGDPRIMAHTLDGIIRSDRWFTIPGVLLIIAFGMGAAIMARLPILGTGWILHSLILFAISGLAFMGQVAPLQRKLLALAREGVGGRWDPAAYHRLSRRWELWGAVAVLTPLAALVLMVVKPG